MSSPMSSRLPSWSERPLHRSRKAAYAPGVESMANLCRGQTRDVEGRIKQVSDSDWDLAKGPRVGTRSKRKVQKKAKKEGSKVAVRPPKKRA